MVIISYNMHRHVSVVTLGLAKCCCVRVSVFSRKQQQLEMPIIDVVLVEQIMIYLRSCNLQILVAARSKAWVYCRSLARIVSSNLARGVSVWCECRVLQVRGLGVEQNSYRGVLPTVV